MAYGPEVLYDLVPQEFEAVNLGEKRVGTRIEEFEEPKELAFSGDASLLTPREQEFMEGIIEGKSYQQVASDVGIAYGTLNNHKNAHFRMFGRTGACGIWEQSQFH